jgi:hypothetical protein
VDYHDHEIDLETMIVSTPNTGEVVVVPSPDDVDEPTDEFNIDTQLWHVLVSLPDESRDLAIRRAWYLTDGDLLKMLATVTCLFARSDSPEMRSELFEINLKIVLFADGLADKPPVDIKENWLRKLATSAGLDLPPQEEATD